MGDEAQYLSDTIGAEYEAYKYCRERDRQAASEHSAMQRMISREVRGQIKNLENDLKQIRESRDYWKAKYEEAKQALMNKNCDYEDCVISLDDTCKRIRDERSDTK